MVLLALGVAACGDAGGAGADPEDMGGSGDAAVASDGAEPTSDTAPPSGLPPDAEAPPQADAAPPAPAFCEGPTAHRWDPLSTEEPDLFPDGLLVRDDPDSPTGQRLDLSPEAAPWVATSPALLKDAVEFMNALSGFGSMGGALLRFTAPVLDLPASAEESLTGDGWQWWDLGGEAPQRVPFEARTLEDGLTVVLWPLRPLRLNTPHLLLVTRAATAGDGECIAPAPTTRALLTGEPALPNAARLERFAPAYRAALAQVGVAPADVTALSVFRTHDDLAPIRAAAADVLTKPVIWGPPGGCNESEGLLECEASTTVLDYRDARGVVDGRNDPHLGPIPVTWWRPAGRPGPFPVVVYGHGLSSRRTEGREFARRVADLGMAVVAMEAVEHGDHPFRTEGVDEDAMRFLGLDLAHLRIDAPRLAGNFNQTNIDRLRLVHLLRQDGDLDGDGAPDLDTSRIAYLGASLGAMCGAGLLALSPDLDAAVLTIGGARLISVVTDTEEIARYRPLIGNLVGSQERFDRLVPVAQHVIDAADPGTWAAHVLQDRFDGRPPPSVLANFGMDDQVVPPSAGRALARALGAPHLAPVQVPVDLVEVIDQAPVQGNRENGTRTAAFFQLSTVTYRGEVVPATHEETAKSDEVAAQIRAFLESWLAGRAPVIVRP